MSNDHEKIRITLDEVKRVVIDPPAPSVTRTEDVARSRSWGRIDAPPSPQTTVARSVGGAKVFFKTWVYLGLAGLAGAFVAWALFEPSFYDPYERRRGVGNILMLPAFAMLVALAFAIAESVVEHSWRKAARRALIAIALGVVLGFIFDAIAQVVYRGGLQSLYDRGVPLNPSDPLHWIVRAIAWSVFGVTGGIVYGIAGQSVKKSLYGVIGGVVGAAIGGLAFDPICNFTRVGGAPSRCIGLMIMGACTGVAIGLVESALKDRWLYVSGGPLAGKQFILYKPQTRIGRDQSNDIYLFKDAAVQPQHAVIELRGGRAVLTATAPTFVAGQAVSQRTLRSGDVIQIGRYSFSYQEKQRPE
jgi:CDP-diglyceride synthetase